MADGDTIKLLAGKLIKGTVLIKVAHTDGSKSSGSGFIADKGNYVITALHVLDNAQSVEIIPFLGNSNDIRLCKPGDWSTGAEVRLMQGGNQTLLWKVDIAAIHIQDTFSSDMALDIDNKPAFAGQEVLFAGYPFMGMRVDIEVGEHPPAPLVSRCIIANSAKVGVDVAEYCYWLDKPSFEGHSGGPVISLLTHKVIGVISAVSSMPKKIASRDGKDWVPILFSDGYAIVVGTTKMPKTLVLLSKEKPWEKKSK